MVGPGTEAVAVAVAVAAAGLPSAYELPPDVLGPAEFSELLRHCASHATLGLLAGVVRYGGLAVESECRGELEQRVRTQYAHDLEVERTLLRIVAGLAAAGIELRVLGPVTLARTVYAEPEQRALDHVDVLVAAADVERATALVSDLASVADDACAVVVHALPYSTAEVFVPAYRFPLAGFELEALAMPQRLLQLCAHPVTPDRREQQIHLRDVAEVVLHERPNLVDVLLLAREWECETELADSITTTWETLAITEVLPLVAWAHRATSGADG